MFDFDKSDIHPDAIIHLDSVISYMNGSPELTLLIGGYCDSRGSQAYNMSLSRRGSNAGLRYLKEKGISLGRMTGTGYGSDKLVNHCEPGVECTDQERQLNRSVYFHFEGKRIQLLNQPLNELHSWVLFKCSRYQFLFNLIQAMSLSRNFVW